MTVIANAGLVLKDSQGNEGIVKSLTDNDIDKISNAITDVGQVVDPATHMPIEATKTSAGVVQLATAQDITNGTAGKVVDAQELNNFAQTLPAANGVTDVTSGDNSNQLVVSRIGGSKTLTIDNVEHAGTATSADSVAWDKVSGKPSTYSPSEHDHGRYGMYFNDVCSYTNTGWYESSYKGVGDDNQTHLYINDYFGIHFRTVGSFDVNGHAIISEENIGSQSVNYANSTGYVQGNNNSANAANALLRSGSGRGDSSPEGDTWIFLDELGGTSAPWGFKHNQAANTIGFYGGGTETSSINLSNGYFSGSCNYANSAGSAENSSYTYWLRTSSHSDHLVHTEWDGGYFWTYVAAPDGGYRAVRVERSNSSGWADSAGSVAWGNVSGRPDIWIG